MGREVRRGDSCAVVGGEVVPRPVSQVTGRGGHRHGVAGGQCGGGSNGSCRLALSLCLNEQITPEFWGCTAPFGICFGDPRRLLWLLSLSSN